MSMPSTNGQVLPPRVAAVVGQLESGEFGLYNDIAGTAAKLIREMAAELKVDNVVVDLKTNTAERRGVTVKLTPDFAVILHKLAESYPLVVSLKDLVRAVWGANTGPLEIQTIRVQLFNLRKRLPPIGVEIDNKHGKGYRLELRELGGL